MKTSAPILPSRLLRPPTAVHPPEHEAAETLLLTEMFYDDPGGGD